MKTTLAAPVPRRLAVALGLAFALPLAPAAGRAPAAQPPAQVVPIAEPAGTRCVDETTFDTGSGDAAAAPLPPSEEPRAMLNELVRMALERSQSLGAAKLLAEAAAQDVDEARSAKSVQASLSGSIGPQSSSSAGITETVGALGRASLNVSQLLFDGGRSDALVDWRGALAEAARQGTLSQQEQIAVNTVALALERSRYRMQVQVYGQYARKMGCLVEALQTIVERDRGRASELVQARKSYEQAELSRVQAQSQMRQVDVRLRRFVGDGLPSPQGLASVLLAVPELDVLQAEVAQAPEIVQVSAQATAAERYARAVAAGTRPQLSWTFSGSKSLAAGGSVASDSASRSASLGVGIAVSIPLLSPGSAYASESARLRAEAAVMQREDAIESRRYRMAEVHEQTVSAFDRAQRIGATLRDSDLVRNYTLQQWQQLGRRSLFDVMSAEADHYGLRVAYVNALHDGQELNAVLLSLGRGITEWLR